MSIRSFDGRNSISNCHWACCTGTAVLRRTAGGTSSHPISHLVSHKPGATHNSIWRWRVLLPLETDLPSLSSRKRKGHATAVICAQAAQNSEPNLREATEMSAENEDGNTVSSDRRVSKVQATVYTLKRTTDKIILWIPPSQKSFRRNISETTNTVSEAREKEWSVVHKFLFSTDGNFSLPFRVTSKRQNIQTRTNNLELPTNHSQHHTPQKKKALESLIQRRPHNFPSQAFTFQVLLLDEKVQAHAF